MSKPKEEKNIQIPEEILKDLLTPSEVRMLKNRWRILNLLDRGLPIREIASEAGVGTDTVMRVSRMKEQKQIKIKEDNENKQKTSWIFGKGKD